MTLTEKDELKEISVADIFVNPHQPRREFKSDELEGLAQSIQSVGLIHPPLVRPVPHGYELISGERRLRASRLAGLKTIPVYVRKIEDSLSAQSALIENIQRVELNPMEIARSLRYLMKEFSMSQELLSQKIGKKRSTIANYLRLLTLPEEIQKGVEEDKISMGHAKAILSLATSHQQQWLYQHILRDQLNVRETENAAQKLGEKAKKEELAYVPRDFYLEAVAEKLKEKIGSCVCITPKAKGGRISIDYHDLNDLERLLESFGVKEEA